MATGVQLEVERVVRPIWAQAPELQQLTGVPASTIRRMATTGQVRSVKLGRARQATRVYRVSDVLELLDMATPEGVLDVAEDQP